MNIMSHVCPLLTLQIPNLTFCPLAVYDDSLPSSLRILAAHVYYRSLMMIPSIVRTWWLECKDRQLSASVASYTSQQFSPKIIEQQLGNVKFPHILDELQSESLSIKTVAALHEIMITYLIDDQQLEIGLRFPPDYPLHGVEIKDIKRIGVQENKWRGWLFNVQQIAQVYDISDSNWVILTDVTLALGKNGLVIDALFWFKKNVTSYFEGKVECAICYSYVNGILVICLVVDRHPVQLASSVSWTARSQRSRVKLVKIVSMLGVCIR